MESRSRLQKKFHLIARKMESPLAKHTKSIPSSHTLQKKNHSQVIKYIYVRVESFKPL